MKKVMRQETKKVLALMLALAVVWGMVTPFALQAQASGLPQSTVTWLARMVGNTAQGSNDNYTAAVQVAANTYIVVGTTGSSKPGSLSEIPYATPSAGQASTDCVISKVTIDQDGKVVPSQSWTQRYGSGGTDQFTAVTAVKDSTGAVTGVAVGGYSTKSTTIGDFGGTTGPLAAALSDATANQYKGSNDGFVIRFSLDSAVQAYTGLMGGTNSDTLKSLCQTGNGEGFIASLNSASTDCPLWEPMQNTGSVVLKLNQSLQKEWATIVGVDTLNSVARDSDGGYIACGYLSNGKDTLNQTLPLMVYGSNDGVVVKFPSWGR